MLWKVSVTDMHSEVRMTLHGFFTKLQATSVFGFYQQAMINGGAGFWQEDFN